METVLSLLAAIVVMFAATGLIAMIAILVTLSIIKDGGCLTLGYEEDDEDEIINTNNNEQN